MADLPAFAGIALSGSAGPCARADLDHDGRVDEDDLQLEIEAIFGAPLPERVSAPMRATR